jgi:hypothetical protein
MQIKVEGLDEVQRVLKDLSERRIRAAAATALTRTAVQVRQKVQQHAQQVFDRPTPYTMRQLRYVGATAAKPVAAVGFNVAPIQDVFGNVVAYRDLGPGQTPAGKYLQFQTEGGRRAYKRFERALQLVGAMPPGWFAVPGSRAKVDAYGNQSVGEIRQILSWFDAAELVAGSRQNMRQAGRDKRRKGTRKSAGFEYVAIPPGTRGLRPGIYRRTFFAMGRRIEPVVIFVRGANYRKRFDFYGVAGSEARRMLPREFTESLRQSIERMRTRRGQ